MYSSLELSSLRLVAAKESEEDVLVGVEEGNGRWWDMMDRIFLGRDPSHISQWLTQHTGQAKPWTSGITHQESPKAQMFASQERALENSRALETTTICQQLPNTMPCGNP